MASIIRVDQIQTANGTNVMSFDSTGKISSAAGIDVGNSFKLPSWTTAGRPATPQVGTIGFNTDDEAVELYNGTDWTPIGSGGKNDGSSPEKAATSATELKATLGASATNGAYWYVFSDGGTRQLWTDFTTFPNYSFVMVTRISNTTHNHYLTTEQNVTNLALIPNDSAPSSMSKLSDAYMNEIIVPGTIRFAIVGPGSTFYRLDDSPQWTSNHGAAASCSYTTGFYNNWATPSNNPVWQNFGAYMACGGGYDSSNAWLSLTGIHVNDSNYTGGYSGSSSGRLSPPPSPYVVGGSNGSWGQNGYVLLSW